MGGLSRKALRIKEISSKRKLPYMLVDGGNLLFDRVQRQAAMSQKKIMAAGLTDIYSMMNYQAVAVGPLDLAAGSEFLKQSQDQGFPWISINVYDNNKNLLFEPYKSIKFENLKIAIVGLTGKSLSTSARYRISDGLDELKNILPSISSDHDLVILLSSLPHKNLLDIAQHHPEINIIVGADRKKGNIQTRLVNETLLTQTADQGKYLGLLSVYWNSHPWGVDKALKLANLKNRLGSINQQLKRMKSSKDKKSKTYTKRSEFFETNRLEVIEEISSLESDMNNNSEQDVPSSYSSLIIPLRTSLAEDPEILTLVESVKEKVKSFNKRGSMTSNRKTRPIPRTRSKFVGSNSCIDCHRVQTEFWQTTDHSAAYKTLAQKNQAYNLDCLPCHVTHDSSRIGSNDYDRNELLSLPVSLRSVGCEVCHGAARAHLQTPERIKPVKRAAKTVCLQCHTPERDNNFNYGEDILTISCPV